MAAMQGKRVLLIIGGGIAAYKVCELIRLLRRAECAVTCVLTANGAQFVTPMTLTALSNERVHTDLWEASDEAEIGHIQLSRRADLVVVCPATANLLARMAGGIADDLATTLLLATDTPVLAVPAMNVRMWQHAATRRNVGDLRAAGVAVMAPAEGAMACGEYGPGRLPEPQAIFARIAEMLGQSQRLAGRHVLVTAGPTHEPIDPVRFLANRSSGKQGFAVAAAAAAAGARVTLIAGPVSLETPAGVRRIDVETASEMATAVEAALAAEAVDIAVMVAAVADWRVDTGRGQKIKKCGAAPTLALVENPDILARTCASPHRPRLVIGFAAETEGLLANAAAKRVRKGADWIVANDVSGVANASVMGGETNTFHIITAQGTESLPEMRKEAAAAVLVARIADAL